MDVDGNLTYADPVQTSHRIKHDVDDESDEEDEYGDEDEVS